MSKVVTGHQVQRDGQIWIDSCTENTLTKHCPNSIGVRTFEKQMVP